MNPFAVAVTAVGYAMFYWGFNCLIQAYKRTGTMNPPTLAMVLGVPNAGTPNPATQTNTATPPPASFNPQGTDPNSINYTPSLTNDPNWVGQ